MQQPDIEPRSVKLHKLRQTQAILNDLCCILFQLLGDVTPFFWVYEKPSVVFGTYKRQNAAPNIWLLLVRGQQCALRQRALQSKILFRSLGSYTLANAYIAGGVICFTNGKGFFNGVISAMTSFSSCITNHPAGTNTIVAFFPIIFLNRAIISVSSVFTSSSSHSNLSSSSLLSLYWRLCCTMVPSRSATW